MGCRCCRLAPAIEPIQTSTEGWNDVREQPKPVIDREQKAEDSVFHDDQLIDTLIKASQRDQKNTDIVQIEDADPEAFSAQFLRQREQVINNPSYRQAIQSWRCRSLDELVNSIRSLGFKKPLLHCHWMIFYWIALNIEYDTVSYFTKNYASQNAEDVFRNRKGVCAGYGNLYKYIADQLDLSCEVVSGYSKGYGFDSRAEAPTTTDHAWNAVQIDGYWYLVESTWAAGSINDQKQFERKFNSYYFLSRPKEMIYHHLPENSRWQLLKQPVSMNQYWSMPKLSPAYFAYHLDLISPRQQFYVELVPNKPFALVLIRTPSHIDLIADLKMNNEKVIGASRVMFNPRKNIFCCYFARPAAGKYQINIYAKDENDQNTLYAQAVELVFDVVRLPLPPISYPTTWKPYFELGLNVLSPKNTHLIRLEKGQGYALAKIQTPSNVELLGRLENAVGEEIQGGYQVYYDREQKYWRCYFAPNGNGMFTATILAKRKDEGQTYHAAVAFTIEAKGIPTPPISYPWTWQLFHDYQLHIDVPRNSSSVVWPSHASFCEVRVRAPDHIRLSAGIEHQGVREENATMAHYDRQKQQWQLLFAPQKTGEHFLFIFARDQSNTSTTTSNSVAKLTVHVTKLKRPMTFPVIYEKFYQNKCQIYEPLNGVLKRDAIVPIHCVIPGARDIQFCIDSKWVEADSYNDPILQSQIPVGSKEVIVYARYGENNNYNGLIRYSVQ